MAKSKVIEFLNTDTNKVRQMMKERSKVAQEYRAKGFKTKYTRRVITVPQLILKKAA